jgi:hypothetical protein
MSYARHQTFYIRANWFSKALEELKHDSTLFSDKGAPRRLGIGTNMVEALRFWVGAANLVVPRGRELTLTQFGQFISEHDPYFEQDTTWWLVHYYLVTNQGAATSWYLVFNNYPHRYLRWPEFQEFVNVAYDESASESSLRKDFDCILSTYVADSSTLGTPEDNISCPLRRLSLMARTNPHVVQKVPPKVQPAPEVLYLVLKENLAQYANVQDLAEKERGPGRVFNLTLDQILIGLKELEDRDLVKYSRTGGIDSVIVSDRDPWVLLEQSYRRGLC